MTCPTRTAYCCAATGSGRRKWTTGCAPWRGAGRRGQQRSGRLLHGSRHRRVQYAGRQRQFGEGTGAGGAAGFLAGTWWAGSRSSRRSPMWATKPGSMRWWKPRSNGFKGRELLGKSLGVVGLGAIGSLVARAALDLGMEVLGHDPGHFRRGRMAPAERGPTHGKTCRGLFAQSDYVTLHVPLLPETEGLVNRESFRAFRRGAVLLNFAREPIVERGALEQALDDGTPDALCRRLPGPGAHRPSPGAVHTPPGRQHGRSGGELCRDGRKPAHQLPGNRQHRQFGQLPVGIAGTVRGVSAGRHQPETCRACSAR